MISTSTIFQHTTALEPATLTAIVTQSATAGIGAIVLRQVQPSASPIFVAFRQSTRELTPGYELSFLQRRPPYTFLSKTLTFFQYTRGTHQPRYYLQFPFVQVAGSAELEEGIVAFGDYTLEDGLIAYQEDSSLWGSIEAFEDTCKLYQNGNTLLKYLPAEYDVQDVHDDLKQFLQVVAVRFDEFYCFIEQFTSIFDPERCDPKYLPYLAHLINYPLSTRGFDSTNMAIRDAAVARARRQLMQAVEVYKRKGLKEAFQILFYGLGYYIELVELWTDDYVNFDETVPADGSIYHPTLNPKGWFKSPYFGIKLVALNQNSVWTEADSGAGQPWKFDTDDLKEVTDAIKQIRPVHTVLWWLNYFFDLADRYDKWTDVPTVSDVDWVPEDRMTYDICDPDDPVYTRNDLRLVGATREYLPQSNPNLPGPVIEALRMKRIQFKGVCHPGEWLTTEIGTFEFETDKYCVEVYRHAGQRYRNEAYPPPRDGSMPTRDPSAFGRRNGYYGATSRLAPFFPDEFDNPADAPGSLVPDRSGCYPPQDQLIPLYQIVEEAEDGVTKYYNEWEFKNWLDIMVRGYGVDMDLAMTAVPDAIIIPEAGVDPVDPGAGLPPGDGDGGGFPEGSSLPVVAYPTASVVGGSATLGATLLSSGTSALVETGVVVVVAGTNAAPVKGGAGVTTLLGATALGSFSVDTSSLIADTAYAFRAFATNASGTSYTVISTFSTSALGVDDPGTPGNPLAPTVIWPWVGAATPTSVAVGATATADGGSLITQRGVLVIEGLTPPTIGAGGVTLIPVAGTTGPFSVTVADLVAETAYTFRAFATNSVGTSYSVPIAATTAAEPVGGGPDPTAPVLATPTASQIDHDSATMGADVTSDGGSVVIERGIVYAPSATSVSPALGDAGTSSVAVAGTTGAFTSTVDTLAPETAYTFRAYATNAVGTTYASPIEFSTPLFVTPPVVANENSADVAYTSATVGGEVLFDGGAEITERGIIYSLASENADPTIGGIGVMKHTVTGTIGAFTIGLSLLAVGTTYIFKVFATNSVGTTYTVSATFSTTATAAPTVGSPTATDLLETSAVLGGTVVDDNGAAITERGVVYSLTTVNGDPLIGGANVTKVTAAGTTGTFFANAGSLTADTGYTYKAFATNSVGTTYTTPAPFTTAAGAALVFTANVFSTEASGADGPVNIYWPNGSAMFAMFGMSRTDGSHVTRVDFSGGLPSQTSQITLTQPAGAPADWQSGLAYGGSAAIYDNKIHFIGEVHNDNSHYYVVFDPATNTAEWIGIIPYTVGGVLAFVQVDSKLYLFGSTWSPDTSVGLYTVIDLPTRTWLAAPVAAPASFYCGSGVAVGNYIYLLSSSTYDDVNPFYRFNTLDDSFVQLDNAPKSCQSTMAYRDGTTLKFFSVWADYGYTGAGGVAEPNTYVAYDTSNATWSVQTVSNLISPNYEYEFARVVPVAGRWYGVSDGIVQVFGNF